MDMNEIMEGIEYRCSGDKHILRDILYIFIIRKYRECKLGIYQSTCRTLTPDSSGRCNKCINNGNLCGFTSYIFRVKENELDKFIHLLYGKIYGYKYKKIML